LRQPAYIQALLAAGVHAANVGITLLDADTRFQSVNAALARETRASPDQHIGKNSREIVGELATQIEPTYEKVLRTGKPASVWLAGHVRDTQETGYWMDYCFPVMDKSRRVQQLGLFVVNVTAETASGEILNTLVKSPVRLTAPGRGVLERFDEAVRSYYSSLSVSLRNLASPCTEAARKAEIFRLSLELLDEDIRIMRELIYAVVDECQVPRC
jgi:hypothetical protein